MFRSMLTCSLILLALSAFGQLPQSDSATPKPLCETGQATKLISGPDKPGEINVVSYNIRWRTGAELEQIASWLKSKHALIIALQEVDRAKERTGKTNNARALAESLGMFYAWAAPPAPKENQEEECHHRSSHGYDAPRFGHGQESALLGGERFECADEALASPLAAIHQWSTHFCGTKSKCSIRGLAASRILSSAAATFFVNSFN